jgi:DNA (cytosine-5)-methyltransferase 1
MRILDLFCGAGGAAMGLYQHWPEAEIIGVDIVPQPRYPFEFVQGDATTAELKGCDFVWASPPCQAHTSLKIMHNARVHTDLIPATRSLLTASGIPWVMENVVGAPLVNPIRLCGSSFNLGVEVYDGWRQLRRHRLFESSFPIGQPKCAHAGATIGIYGDHARDRRRKLGVRARGIDFPDCDRIAIASNAMSIDWMNWKELSQAIPPAYSRYIAQQFDLNRS